jgi:hypothetical protein
MSKNLCQDGQNCQRPIGSGPGNDAVYAKSVKMCNPHATEAGYENEHSDYGHETFETLTVRKSSFKTKAELDAYKAQLREETARCWICHPELNEATKPYTTRQGTSRAGIVIHVTIRAAGETKAAETQAQIEAIGGEGEFKFKIATAKKTGEVAFTATGGKQEFILFWDARGRFIGGSVRENGKTRKVRNVAEVLRIAS